MYERDFPGHRRRCQFVLATFFDGRYRHDCRRDYGAAEPLFGECDGRWQKAGLQDDVERRFRGRSCGIDEGTNRRTTRHGDDWFATERFPSDAAFPRGRMLKPPDQHETVAHNGDCLNVVARLRVGQAYLDPFRTDRFNDFVTRQIDDVHRNPRMFIYEVLHELWQDRGCQRRKRCDSDSPLSQGPIICNVGQGFVERGKRFLCDLVKLSTDRREFDITGVPVEQCDAEIILKLANERT
jgi:hypothetical protein